MKVTAENDRCIAVELTDDDMKKLDITYDELDYSNVETRRVLWTLLDEARRVSGKTISLADQLLIETMPSEKGGCVILFISVPTDEGGGREKTKLMSRTAPLVCDFDSADHFLDFCGRLPDRDWIGKAASLYEKDGVYRAVMQPDLKNRDKLQIFAGEFGRCRADRHAVMAAHTAEYWHCIADELSESFSGGTLQHAAVRPESDGCSALL